MNELVKPQMEMPRYQCHKKVWALKIHAILRNQEGATIVPSNATYAPFSVDFDYLEKHKPESGGYFVVYEDGYKSWSPAKAFEEGYTKIE
jgi:hypothetical protein